MDTAKTGAYLASLRKAAGMTQQDAADRLGVSASLAILEGAEK